MKKVFLTILFLLVAAGVAGWISLRRFERRQLYHPVAAVAATPAQFSLRYQDVQFSAADGAALVGGGVPPPTGPATTSSTSIVTGPLVAEPDR